MNKLQDKIRKRIKKLTKLEKSKKNYGKVKSSMCMRCHNTGREVANRSGSIEFRPCPICSHRFLR